MSKRATGVIFAGFLTLFVAFAIRYSYGILLPFMLDEFQISKTAAGGIFSAYFVAFTVAVPFVGLMADRLNIRVLVTLATFLIGIGTVLMSFSTSVVNASLFFMIAGLGHSACWVPFAVLVQRWVTGKWKGTALAFTEAGSATGIIVISATMPFIIREFDWRMGWLILGLTAFLATLVNLLWAANPPESKGQTHNQPARHTGASTRAAYISTFRDTRFWLLGISYLLVGFLILIPFTFLTTYAFGELQLSFQAASGLITITGISGIAGKLLLGSLSDRLGRLQMMIASSALLAAGCLGMVFFHGYGALSVFTVIFGLGYGAVWPIYAAAVPEYFPANRTGTIFSLWQLLAGLGSIASPVISGRVIDMSGTFPPAFIMAAVAAVISILLLLITGKPSKRGIIP